MHELRVHLSREHGAVSKEQSRLTKRYPDGIGNSDLRLDDEFTRREILYPVTSYEGDRPSRCTESKVPARRGRCVTSGPKRRDLEIREGNAVLCEQPDQGTHAVVGDRVSDGHATDSTLGLYVVNLDRQISAEGDAFREGYKRLHRENDNPGTCGYVTEICRLLSINP